MKIQKLYPICKDYIWGGVKLKNKYGKKTELSKCAESWELSFHDDGLTELDDGLTLKQCVTDADVGKNASKFDFFPLMIKFIDAAENLSVQVHPSDEYALKTEKSLGKTEMWYIVEADEGAGIYLGLRQKVSAAQLAEAISDGTVTELLQFKPVHAGESYFIPAGTLHAIGKGCLICEIQQNSNVTYRVYDYGRKGADGKPRELHIDKALQVSCLDKYNAPEFRDGILGECAYFCVKKITVESIENISMPDGSFCAMTCVEGCGTIDGNNMVLGDTFFVPADYRAVELSGSMTVIMTYVPN